MEAKYKRVLLKVSGEAIAKNGTGIDPDGLAKVAEEVRQLRAMGVEVGIVVGGGNFWRGRTSEGMDRCTADQIGMLATCMNGLALKDAFRQAGIPAELMAAFQLAANTFVNEHLDDFTWTGFDIYFLKAGENQPKCGFTCSGLKTKNEAIKRACELFPTDPRYVETIIINNANNDKYQFSREEFTHLTSEQLAAKKRISEE